MKKYTQAILFQNGGVGDFLMAIFLAEQLKAYGVTEKVHIIVHKGSAFLGGFIGEYPYISLFEISLRAPASLLSLFRLFGRKNLVILPPTIGHFELKTKFLAAILARPDGSLIGFQDTGPLCTTLYSKTIPYNIHQCFDKSMFDILRALGISVTEKAPHLRIREAPDVIQRLGLADTHYVLVHPRGGSDKRRLSGEEAAELIDFILSTSPTRRVLLSGAEHERQAIEGMAAAANDSARVKTTIGASPAELAALIEGAEVFVGMDTGITHFACFLGKKTLVIAKNATANWLPYYNKQATIVFRFEEDEKSYTSEEYMRAHQNGRLRPFKDVPMRDVNVVLAEMLRVPG